MNREIMHMTAGLIGGARVAGRPVGPLPEDRTPADDEIGYAVQDVLHRWFAENGVGRRRGWKLGCTTPVMQELVGVASPVYGGVPESAIHHGNAVFDRSSFQAPGVECEIAVRFGEDLPADARLDRATVAGHIDAAMVAIEVVDNRYGDWASVGTPTLIADDFFHAACVLGPPMTGWRRVELASVKGRTKIDGTEVGTGRGADVMGHPLDAVVWLASALAGRGQALRAGDVVLTGSIVATQWIDTCPCDVEVCIDALGAVGARFE